MVRWYEDTPADLDPANAKGTKQKEKKQAKGVKAAASVAPVPRDPAAFDKQYKDALTALEAESRKFDALANKGETGWLVSLQRSGTLTDRTAALTLMVRQSPLHRLKALEQLVAMAKKKAKHEVQVAVDALKDLFLNNILPPDRQLRFFYEQPGLDDPRATSRHMLYWAFEDAVKRVYADFLSVLEAASKDTVLRIKESAVYALAELLRGRPEQRGRVLAALVNKLGDTEKRICGLASKSLCEVLLGRDTRPMKRVVIDEVERFLLRKNLPTRSQYYALLVLNQILFTKDEGEIAGRLVGVYLAFFKAASEGKDSESKTLSALLTGIHRAFPYATIGDDAYAKHEDSLFVVVHKSSFNKSVQALQVLLQIMSARRSVSDRYYTALYSRVLAEDVLTSKKLATFLNLVYRSVKADPVPSRAAAFVKRMLQICAYCPANFVCGFLIILSELVEQRPKLRAMLDTSSKWHGDDDDDDGPSGRQANAVDLSAQGRVEDGDVGAYFPLKRDPRYTNADRTMLWELVPLANHTHPTVAKYAQTLLNGEYIEYAGDPLANYSLANFLDRFSFKNPKQRFQTTRRPEDGYDEDADNEGEDEKVVSTKDVFKTGTIRSSDILPPANAPASLRRKESDIPVEEKFFYEFFKLKGASDALDEVDGKKKKKKSEGDEDEEDSAVAAADDEEDDEGKEEEDGEDAAGGDYSDMDIPSEGDSIAGSDDEEALGRMLLEEISGSEDGNDDDGGEGEDDEGALGGSGDFADAEEFDEVLAGGTSKVNPRQLQWEAGKRIRKGSKPLKGGVGSKKRSAPSGGKGKPRSSKRQRN